VRLVLWDLDGTLVDTAGHGKHAFDEAFEALAGRPAERWPPFAGRTDHAIAIDLLELNAVASGDGAVGRLLEGIHAALAARFEAMRAEGSAQPGAPEAVAALARRDDVLQTALTGNIERNAELKLRAYGLDAALDLGVGAYGDDHVVRAELIQIALDRVAELRGLELSAADAVLIGDTPLDIEAAHAGGARGVGVATGPFGEEELRAAGADTVLPDLTDGAALAAALALP
jgi:phosphoglycolate phosphatase-like HAD superfamily hydrolase